VSTNDTLRISEIFFSIQGESTMAGLPCIFIRLQGCGLRCSWCDTQYALDLTADADVSTFDEIIAAVKKFGCDLIEVTGGEPLEQPGVNRLMTLLCDAGYRVMMETGGYLSVEDVDPRVKKIVDLKCPSSGMEKKNYLKNIAFLTPHDEIKFVIGTEEDYQWTKLIIEQYRLDEKCAVLLSPVFGVLQPVALSEWLLRDRLTVRLQLQMHKFIWDPAMRGV
jgi:7-carboxy-7-deazaguanine synthase